MPDAVCTPDIYRKGAVRRPRGLIPHSIIDSNTSGNRFDDRLTSIERSIRLVDDVEHGSIDSAVCVLAGCGKNLTRDALGLLTVIL